MEQLLLKSEYQEEREKIELGMYNDYINLMAVGGQRKIAVKQYLMKKYGIHSIATVYNMLRRAEKRVEDERQGIFNL